MYFFTLSSGTYTDYAPTILYHQEEISRVQFFEMCQEVVKQGFTELEEMVEALCKQYGFSEAVSRIEINSYSEDFSNITKYSIDESRDFFGLEP